MVLYLGAVVFFSLGFVVFTTRMYFASCTYQFLLFMNDCHANAKDVFTHDQFDVNHSWHSLCCFSISSPCANSAMVVLNHWNYRWRWCDGCYANWLHCVGFVSSLHFSLIQFKFIRFRNWVSVFIMNAVCASNEQMKCHQDRNLHYSGEKKKRSIYYKS